MLLDATSLFYSMDSRNCPLSRLKLMLKFPSGEGTVTTDGVQEDTPTKRSARRENPITGSLEFIE